MKILVLNADPLDLDAAAVLYGLRSLARRNLDAGDPELLVATDDPDRARQLHPSLDFVPDPVARALGDEHLVYAALPDLANAARVVTAGLLRGRGGRRRHAVGSALLGWHEREAFEALHSADRIVLLHAAHTEHATTAAALAAASPAPTLTLWRDDGQPSKPVERALLRASHTILVPGEADHRRLHDLLGPRATPAVTTTPPLALAVDEMPALPEPVRPRGERPETIALSVSQSRHSATNRTEAYDESIRVLTTHLISRRRARVVFVSSRQAVSGRPDDAALARTIADPLPPEIRSSVILDDTPRPAPALAAMLSRFDLTITSHTSMAALAARVDTPTLGLADDALLRRWLVEHLERPDLLLERDALSPDRLVDAVDGLLDTPTPHLPDPARIDALLASLDDAAGDWLHPS